MSDARSVWAESAKLATYLRDYAWAAPTMLVLGVAAAIAETLGVSLAVMFLFSVLGQTDEIASGDGLFSAVFRQFENTFGSDPTLIAAGFVVLILGNALLIYAYQVLTATLMNRIAERMRDVVHETYVTVGYRHLQTFDRGALIHTLASETWAVSEALHRIARIGVNLCAMVIFSIGLILFAWQIGLTVVVTAIAGFTFLRVLLRPLRRYSDQTLAENRILYERMLVSLNGMRTIRAFAQERYILRIFGASSVKVRMLAVKAERLKSLIGPLGEVVGLVVLVLIALVAKNAGIDTATTVASVLLLMRLQPHMRELDSHRVALAGLSASLRNVRETLGLDRALWPRPGHIEHRRLQGEIRFEDVSFVHDPRRAPSLDKASFVIRRGETTALSGPSGSGKTTIINLLLRLYEPDAGRITVDGVDMLDLTRESWLGSVAIAGQDVELVEGTVAQNIRLARHEATAEELRQACEDAGILDDILDIPEGFDARIGPGGLSFSGGQRQRIGLARALIRKPDILILDEALSALETGLEDRIKNRIAGIMEGRTIITVSHRADALATADAVIRIDHGRIVSPDVARDEVARVAQ